MAQEVELGSLPGQDTGPLLMAVPLVWCVFGVRSDEQVGTVNGNL